MLASDKHFFVTSSSAVFNERQKSIFNVLDKAEECQPQNRYTEEELRESESRMGKINVVSSKRDLKQFQGKESIFKRPEIPLKRKWRPHQMPDFKKNPHKWTKYSLEDVGIDDMSDKRNTATAVAFLKELSERTLETVVEEEPTLPANIKFNKLNDCEMSDEDKTKPCFINGKFTMPEYVVGQKLRKPMRRTVSMTPYIKLDHLLEEDEME